MADGYDIVTAKENDVEIIADFLRQNFYKQSPLSVASGATADRHIEDMFPLQFLTEGTSLLAVSRSGRHILGACINGENRPNDETQNDLLQSASNEAYAKIYRFVDKMEKAVDIWKLTGADRALYVHILGVDPSARGQGIGKALMAKTRDKARSLGYPLLRILCTSAYSIRIARNMGMRSVYTLPFSEYKDEKGHPILTPPYPHTEGIMFVQKLDPQL
jgi:GNAT superfamily N-acetyltransferase